MKSAPIWVNVSGSTRKHEPSFGGRDDLDMVVHVGSSSTYSYRTGTFNVRRFRKDDDTHTFKLMYYGQSESGEYPIVLDEVEYNHKTREFKVVDRSTVLDKVSSQTKGLL